MSWPVVRRSPAYQQHIANGLSSARAAEHAKTQVYERAPHLEIGWQGNPCAKPPAFLTPPEHDHPTAHANPPWRPNWRPPVPAEPRPVRRQLYWVRQRIRRWSRPRIRACGMVPLSGGVGVVVSAHGGARYTGLAHCTCLWECPACRLAIVARRSDEVAHVVARHGQDRVAMLSLTIRHAWDDDLRELRSKLADAWRGMTRGAPWKRFCARLGVIGAIRALEVTRGPNGWHPHLHVLLLLEEPIASREVIELEDDEGRKRREWMPHGARGWAIERWQTMVARYVGAEHTPDDEHGLSLAPCHVAAYLSKLGLELVDPGTKVAHGANRTPLEIAYDLARRGRAEDVKLWRAYCDGMRGARQLTWSRGLKARFGVPDRTDEELAGDQPTTDDVVIGYVPVPIWRDLVVSEIGQGDSAVSATVWLLEQAERGGAPALTEAILRIAAGEIPLTRTVPRPRGVP